MKIFESSQDSQTLSTIRDWRTAFLGIADSIKIVEEFLTNPEAYKDDENRMREVFNSLEVLKDCSDKTQKEAIDKAYDLLVEMAGHQF